MKRILWGRVEGSLVIAVILAVFLSQAVAQNSVKKDDKSLDIRSNYGDLHLGADGNPGEVGLPVYPGSRLRHSDENNSAADLALFTQAFGFKLVVVNYDSDDSPAKLIAYYRDKLKKYGKVLECRTDSPGNHIQVNKNTDDSSGSKELKCDDENEGTAIELKAGTEDNQHDVAIKPADKGNGSTFALVYIYARGKQGDI
jgi:hypothetical protein